MLRPDDFSRRAGGRFIFVLDRVLGMHSAKGRIARLAKSDSICVGSGLDHL